MSQPTVLLVVPDGADRQRAVERLEEIPAAVVCADSVEQAAQRLEAEHGVDCVVTEYDLGDGTGIDLVAHVRGTAPDTACILFTASDRDGIETGALESVVEYVDRDAPDALDRLAALVESPATRRGQRAYPCPGDEQARLSALEQYDLDADSLEEAVDRVTTLAARHFEVPLASVNVIDAHTQEFLGCYGADWSTVPRETAVCTYTILGNGVTVVPDVREDPRFADNEMLAEYGIRFYAGANLVTSEGGPIGTLCVYDEQSREFTDDDREYLQLLADEVVAFLELHRRVPAGGDGGVS